MSWVGSPNLDLTICWSNDSKQCRLALSQNADNNDARDKNILFYRHIMWRIILLKYNLKIFYINLKQIEFNENSFQIVHLLQILIKKGNSGKNGCRKDLIETEITTDFQI